VNVALPALRDDLGASLGDQQWVVEAYLLLASQILVGGSLGDLYVDEDDRRAEDAGDQREALGAGLVLDPAAARGPAARAGWRRDRIVASCTCSKTARHCPPAARRPRRRARLLRRELPRERLGAARHR